jgi:hypothetical protein
METKQDMTFQEYCDKYFLEPKLKLMFERKDGKSRYTEAEVKSMYQMAMNIQNNIKEGGIK